MKTEKGGDCRRNTFTREQGFTLIELAIVVVISGFIMASLSTGMAMYRKQRVLDTTYNNIQSVKTAVERSFNPIFGGRYPRPAGRNLSPVDTDYGIEVSTAELAALGGFGCTPSGVCRVPGRDADGDGNPDPVLIGALPAKMIRDEILQRVKDRYDDAVTEGYLADYRGTGLDIHNKDSVAFKTNLDGWGRMFTYAVTEALTDSTTFDNDLGAISIETETGENLLRTAGSAYFVIISHGPDGKGGYTPEGNLYKPCTVAAGPGQDLENCDDADALFVSGLTSLKRSADYFDDILFFHVQGNEALWIPVGSSAITNTNPGNVGVGTLAPTEKLHILGDLQTGIARGNGYCEQLGIDCMLPATIGGTGISCLSGSSMQGISYNNADCGVDPSTSVNLVNCPAGKILQGVNADGSLNCGP